MFQTVAQRWISGLAAALYLGCVACDGGGGHHGSGDDGGSSGEASCGGGSGGSISTGGGGSLPAVKFADAFPGRSFQNPVKLVQHPTHGNRWYVVEQGGLVKTFCANDSAAPTVAANVRASTNLGGGQEQGLLGMAFDPDFAMSHEIYLTYTDDSAQRSILARWQSGNDGLTFVTATDRIVLSIPHPLDNHNGGDIVFGSDKLLYYSMGDGGGADDPDDNGQDRTVLLGKILRIDVNSAQGGDSYAAPSGNPFALGNAHCNNLNAPAGHPCPEIFALGFRNPWRMNFDPATGKLYVGDVGQNAQEEIDIVTVGGNYGWDCREGELTHATSANCAGVTFVPPEVVHGRTEARAITGGAVYRGAGIPGLRGFYVYGDFLTGLFFAFNATVANAPAQRVSLPTANVSAFGQGRDGEIYVVDFGSPSIQKIVAQ